MATPSPSRTAAAPARPTAVLDTRLPGNREPLTLVADIPSRRWTAGEAEPLAEAIRPALAWLAAQGPDALLVGVADYPHDPHATGAGLSLLGFDTHLRVPFGSHPTGTRSDAVAPFRLLTAFSPDQGAADYCEGVRRVKALLQAGDVYQVNLAQRFVAACNGDPWPAWLALRDRQAAPWAAWVDLGSRQVLGLSPECFLEVVGNQVSTYPIKGTRPRGADPARDGALRTELQRATKDRAENLMIVDLLRNDLGRVCRPGTVRTPALFEVQSFPNVHHLVSTVTGELDGKHDLADLLEAAFPGGSITGAPKRRAREVIRQLETVPRGAYCGSVFWADRQGRLGSNISIRTLTASGGQIQIWGGAGIVDDSIPEKEQQECLDKVGPLMRFLESEFFYKNNLL